MLGRRRDSRTGMWKEGSIEEARNKVFGVFWWEGEGVITLSKTRATGHQWREYGREDVRGENV